MMEIIGTNGPDILTGGEGTNDTLEGRDGDDTLRGFGGADVLIGGAGADLMQGGTGSDTYFVDDPDDVVAETGDDVDTIFSSVSYDLSRYESGFYDPFNNEGVENLTLTGTENINAKGSWWEANTLTGNDGDNLLTAYGSGDTLIGGAGTDYLQGTDGHDVLDGGSGADTMAGGYGYDRYVVDDPGDVVIEPPSVTSDDVYDLIEAWVTYTAEGTIDYLTLMGTAPINGTGSRSLTGNDAANVLTGGGAIYGRGGDDYLKQTGEFGGAMAGGAGNDTYEILMQSGGSQWVVEEQEAGYDTVLSHNGWVLGPHFEKLVLLGVAASGTGNNLANEIVGTAWTNFIDGKAGADTMAGGAGDDYYHVDNPGDVVIEREGEGLDVVTTHAADFSLLGTHVENLYADWQLTGNLRLTGNQYDNRVDGSYGNDTIDGQGGIDLMQGSLGDDVYYVDDPLDVIQEYAGYGLDVVFSTVSYVLTSDTENLHLQGTAAASGTGNRLQNVLTGNEAGNFLDGAGGNDTLDGMGGDDRLAGGAGDDFITGGTGRDVFVFQASGAGIDFITDFQEGEAIHVAAVLAAAPVVAGNGTLTAGGRVQVESLADRSILHVGTDGVQGADLRIELLGNFAASSFRVRPLGDGNSEIIFPLSTPAAPTGSVTISGTPVQSNTLTASNTVGDANGVGPIAYQWFAGGIPIGGATTSTLTLAQPQAGHLISVAASYTDGLGTPESVLSSPTSVVLNVNDPPTGSLAISGAITTGNSVSVANLVSDLDGMGALEYAWTLDGQVVAGATSSSFFVPFDTGGKLLSVTATYIDAFDTLETVSSTPRPIIDLSDGRLAGMVYHWKSHVLVDGVTVSATRIADGAEPQIIVTGGEGRFSFDGILKGTYQVEAHRGAGDSTNAITSADALAALRIAVGLNPNPDTDGAGPLAPAKLSPYQLIAADVNGDGKVSSADALATLRMAVQSPSAPVAKWAFINESLDLWNEGTASSTLTSSSTTWAQSTLSNVRPAATDNRVAVLLGDVNGSWSGHAGSVDLDVTQPTYLQALGTALGVPGDIWGIVG
jgi:Ca2+-binding RTX toxin-like protein